MMHEVLKVVRYATLVALSLGRGGGFRVCALDVGLSLTMVKEYIVW